MTYFPKQLSQLHAFVWKLHSLVPFCADKARVNFLVQDLALRMPDSGQGTRVVSTMRVTPARTETDPRAGLTGEQGGNSVHAGRL